jgi:uncharacterized membrane protein YphA (DoxX/SURF4 family)
MSAGDWSLRETAPAFLAGWNQFFYAPIDARRMAFIRIGFAVLVLIYMAILYPDLSTWYGPQGLYPADVDAETRLPQQWSVLRWLPADPVEADVWLHRVFWLHIACTVMLLIGFLSRINSVIVYVLLVSWIWRNPLIIDGEDSVFRLVGFFLILMPSGRAWSIDRLIFHRKPNTCPLVAAWPLRLLQLQMMVIFVAAALYKMGGTAWLDGTAFSYVGRLDDLFGRFWIPTFVFEVPIVVRLITWSVIVIELFAPLFMWFRETRRWALVAILLFHLGNEYTMALFLFHWIMLLGWSTFLTSDDLSFFSRIYARFFSGKIPSPATT